MAKQPKTRPGGTPAPRTPGARPNPSSGGKPVRVPVKK